tara:strand:+ start:656 stop:817 length:162 start_codon:yes stop_codon:yes gene_type:complete
MKPKATNNKALIGAKPTKYNRAKRLVADPVYRKRVEQPKKGKGSYKRTSPEED